MLGLYCNCNELTHKALPWRHHQCDGVPRQIISPFFETNDFGEQVENI
ncbi:hypothetical protein CHUAL_004993 [Chamberlinius hualienensis]